jgi:hypothetical protein
VGAHPHVPTVQHRAGCRGHPHRQRVRAAGHRLVLGRCAPTADFIVVSIDGEDQPIIVTAAQLPTAALLDDAHSALVEPPSALVDATATAALVGARRAATAHSGPRHDATWLDPDDDPDEEFPEFDNPHIHPDPGDDPYGDDDPYADDDDAFRDAQLRPGASVPGAVLPDRATLALASVTP